MSRAARRTVALVLALSLPLPASAQDACPWGGAVRKVQELDGEVFFDLFDSETMFGRVRDMPACDTTLDAVRAAAKRPGCHLYADRPDALGWEMVFSCLLQQTDDSPPSGTVILFNSQGAELLAPEAAQ
ncbi:MAG: hypothetical protein AAGC92_12485 [Pseudomonadota bacterium]